MTYEEERSIRDIEKNHLSELDDCEVTVLAHYEVYLRRFPEYLKTGNAESNFVNWKNYVAAAREELSPLCMYSYPINKIIRMRVLQFMQLDFYFCGRYSRKPTRPKEHEAYTLIEELLRYAKSGNSSAILSLIGTPGKYTMVTLNADVEYYFRRSALPGGIFTDTDVSGVSHLIPHLTPDRIAFLDDAVERRDFQSVAETTAPCKPRETEE